MRTKASATRLLCGLSTGVFLGLRPMSRAKLWVIAGDVEAAIAGEPFDGDRQMFNGSDHQGRPHCHNRSRTRWSTSAYCAQSLRSDRHVFAFDAMMIGRNRQGGKAARGPPPVDLSGNAARPQRGNGPPPTRVRSDARASLLIINKKSNNRIPGAPYENPAKPAKWPRMRH